MRTAIDFKGTITDLIHEMGEGNPGALNVLVFILKEEREAAFLTFLHLDDMNIRGTQIWAGFKYHCNQDLKLFIEKVKARDAEMVKKINSECLDTSFNELAVTSGASYTR